MNEKVSRELSPPTTAVTSGQTRTPGPWEISDARTIDGNPMVVGGEGSAWGLIAEVMTDADAHLIAAAPRLLSALKSARGALMVAIRANVDLEGFDPASTTIIQEIDAALSSAGQVDGRGPGMPQNQGAA